MDILGIVFALCIGVAISAACGFRVFLPILIIGILQRFGSDWGLPLTVPEGLSWAGNGFILLGLGVATILEITAFYIPWLDSLLDTISAPMAVIAGTVLTYCVLDDASDTSRILLSLIGGGGSAGVVAGTTALVRGASTVLTAGFGNNVVATAENGLSIISVALALFVPVLGVIFLVIFLILIIKVISYLKKKRKEQSVQPEAV
ncbi:MAG: DUF4126 domain-containing protein [Fibrobacter sp.]|nr:DUF4126 domain-containing protein [Fibrobacter sp.]